MNQNSDPLQSLISITNEISHLDSAASAKYTSHTAWETRGPCHTLIFYLLISQSEHIIFQIKIILSEHK